MSETHNELECGPSCYIKENITVGELLKANLEICNALCPTPEVCTASRTPEIEADFEQAHAALGVAQSAVATFLNAWDCCNAKVDRARVAYIAQQELENRKTNEQSV